MPDFEDWANKLISARNYLVYGKGISLGDMEGIIPILSVAYALKSLERDMQEAAELIARTMDAISEGRPLTPMYLAQALQLMEPSMSPWRAKVKFYPESKEKLDRRATEPAAEEGPAV